MKAKIDNNKLVIHCFALKPNHACRYIYDYNTDRYDLVIRRGDIISKYDSSNPNQANFIIDKTGIPYPREINPEKEIYDQMLDKINLFNLCT